MENTIVTLQNPWSGALIDMTIAQVLKQYDYDIIVQLADDEIVERLASELAPCSEAEFVAALYRELGREEFSRITMGA